jgi:menaquinone-dependent protoporphyrinogen oxidase
MILIAYASKYGSTREVAERIAQRLQKSGKQAEVKHVGQIADLGKPEAVIVGSALYHGRWLPEATQFLRANAAALSHIPTWLFSVGPLGTKVDEEQPIELAEFRAKIGHRHHDVFHGALDHSKLDHSDRMTMKAAGAPQGDFRDWDTIAAWVDDMAKSVKYTAGGARWWVSSVANPGFSGHFEQWSCTESQEIRTWQRS